MTEEAARTDGTVGRRRTRIRFWLAIALVLLLFVVAVGPSMVSIGRYKSRISGIVAASLGRPVRVSSVELCLLPRPGFVLTDLTVDEDPAYGAEPVLHANSVTAAIRLESLWRGRIEIGRISVDEASLNLVRAADGRWNLDPLFRTAAARTQSADAPRRARPPLPYLEATNSRVNIKNGLEKLPYSLVNADLSFWQESPDEWRLRLRGQPARTDVSLAQADTGIVRLEASLHRAPELRQMPLHVEMEWREAQLGQLSRLLLGSDPGWRGDLTGEMQLDGTVENARIKARLRAAGVHRAEFAPADALDFDANCSFRYRYTARSIENLACDSPLGDGHIRVAGELPGSDAGKPAKVPVAGRLDIDVQRAPVSAGLDILRTLRNGIPDDLEARGTISGRLAYDPGAAQEAPPSRGPAQRRKTAQASVPQRASLPQPGSQSGPLQGNLTIDGFSLTGGGLSQPIQIARISFTPADAQQPQALEAAASIPAGGASPLGFTFELAARGYQLTARGPASLPRLRELAHMAGMADVSALDALAGAPAVLDLTAHGPWVLPAFQAPEAAAAGADQLTGTITLANANWKSADLTNPVTLTKATLQLNGSSLAWDPVEFAYGPVRGTASLRVPLTCAAGQSCPPQLDLVFDRIDAAALQAALLGAPKQGTVLSSFFDRFTASPASVWPRFDGTLKAGSMILGPVTLANAAVTFSVRSTGAEFTSFDAGLLGGQLHATGSLAAGDKPAYTFEGNVEKAAAPALCALMKMSCTGGPIDASGKLALAGFSAKDLATSASGTLHFDWRNGAIGAPAPESLPRALARFSRWTADASIGHGAVIVGRNQVQTGGGKSAVDADVTFGDPPKISFAALQAASAAKR
ncbi:MAG TPA: AsmA family protein [Terracidiphilus sp.]|nr:AsmA family protein [Terracidiphilus sp.]